MKQIVEYALFMMQASDNATVHFSIVMAIIISSGHGSFDVLAADGARIKSVETRIGRALYVLEVDDDLEELVLTTALKATPSNEESHVRTSLFDVPAKGITELSIAPWNSGGSRLVAVVKRTSHDVISYSCFTFTKLNSDGTIDATRFGQSKIYESSHNYKIMAINARDRGDGLIILLGKLRNDNGFEVATEGVIIMDNCPHHPMIPLVVEWKGIPKFPKLDDQAQR